MIITLILINIRISWNEKNTTEKKDGAHEEKKKKNYSQHTAHEAKLVCLFETYSINLDFLT